ncbi:hypothetical protein GJ688_13930 [Heliobacillus mobilis]|uniref:Uncharacterized protein n=1 Tax=Heliobacterium mobile TaxID=28064 RepID=A0A6I3SM76_HELMO|nr:hypothetical protein [Heliobacterium mobile]MTV50071.1 hypothetical protein [Heliobacterium mobile]
MAELKDITDTNATLANDLKFFQEQIDAAGLTVPKSVQELLNESQKKSSDRVKMFGEVYSQEKERIYH